MQDQGRKGGGLHLAGRAARKTVVATGGGTVVVVGIILMPLPGPGTLIVLVGLAILATEFRWAHRTRVWLGAQASRAAARARERLAARREPPDA
jgi:uncharacterized protein (TIGR02611 family)